MSASGDSGSARVACALAVGAVLGGAAAYAATQRARAAFSAPLLAPAASCSGRVWSGVCLDDEVVGEQLTRNVQFFGRQGQQRVCDAFVVVVGLGVSFAEYLAVVAGASHFPAPPPQGVGSHAAHMLLRSGVGRLRLIDFDQVTLSSLNRHAVATRADVGTPKALALARHFLEIAPETPVDARVAMYEEARSSISTACASLLMPLSSVARGGAAQRLPDLRAGLHR